MNTKIVAQSCQPLLFIFSCMCMDIIYASNWLRMCPFCLCGVVVPQPISAHALNQLTNRSVWFSSLSYVSGKATSVFNHFKLPCQSKKLKTSSWVINFVKKTHTELSGMNIPTEKFVHFMISAERPAR